MANTTYDTIKNMKPAPWSRSTVADGNALNQNFLEPTHQKDLTLAAAIDQVKNTVDGYNETINNISNVADAAKTQATNAISAANEAQDDVEAIQTTVTEMSDAVSAHGESIETLGIDFNTLSAAVASEAEAISNLQNNKQDKIYVDANTISGNGTSDSPYTVIGGNQKELEFVDSTTVTVHKDEQDDKIIYSFSAAGGGGGTSYDMAWIPSVAQNGDISWTWGEYTTAPETRNIKGPKGEDGPTGPGGKTPVLSANSYNLYWKYSDATSGWTNLGNFRGEQGPTGDDGISPSVSTVDIPGSETHPQGGTSVTITDKTGEHQFDVWNGINGEGASVNFLDGNGIHVQQDGINYTISVSADYSGAAVASAKNWVNAQGYVLSGALNPENSISGKWRNGQYYDFGLKASAENALAAVDEKITKPTATQYQNDYVVWNKGLGQEWTDFSAAAESWANSFLLNANTPFISGAVGLSAGLVQCANNYVYKVGINTTNMNSDRLYGFTTNGWSEIDNWFMNRFQFENGVSGVPDMTNYKMHIGLSGDYLPTSGGTVSGSTYFSAANGQNMLAVASAATLIGASRQTSGHFGQDTSALGTTWIGVGGPGMYRGFLKYTQDGNVGDLDTNNTMQVEFTPSNKGTIFAKAKNSGNDCPETQILNPTKASCDAMTTSANANLVSGPNYMLAKNADGQFVIGAACVNCTDINNVTLAPNTYYFVYEV